MAGLGRLILTLLAAMCAMPGMAQTIVSPGADHVAVSVYRDPDRGAGGIADRLPGGYALITETRRVHLPAGPAMIRFEGVASGIFPETVIVRGLPAGATEKNLDADLLSPRSLYDRSLGRAVTIRRTIRGRVVEQSAIIRSGAAGAAVVQTADGVEAVRCSGLPEAIEYLALPPGLTPKPTLSVATVSPVAADVTLTVAYLAAGFDWNADYVLTMRPDGRSADLFAWVTLASGDVTSFPGADAAVIAGKPAREAADPPGFEAGALVIHCWPQRRPGLPPPAPAPPPPVFAPAPIMTAMDIVVTGSRFRAAQEELGDLKLYRLPVPVTVAAKEQKQVAMLDRRAVPLTVVYVSELRADGDGTGPRLTLRAGNRADAGLGLPLPAGKVAVFEGGSRPVLAGEARLADKAIGEDVEIVLAEVPGITATHELLSEKGRLSRHRLTVTNDRAVPIAYEAKLRLDPAVRVTQAGRRPATRDGVPVLAAIVPANGSVVLDYQLVRSRP